jgi:3-methyladenine DNA glycosylase AlkD
MKPQQLYKELQSKFVTQINQDKALWQQKYMKSEMVFLGITAADLKKICSPFFKAHPPANNDEYRATIEYFFKKAKHRQDWYTAILYARHFKKFTTIENMDLYVHMVEIGQWWDIVDEVATKLVGPTLLKVDVSQRRIILTSMINRSNMWVRRTALYANVPFKQQTDIEVLENLILQVAQEKEFFIRKAIGTVLRMYARTNPKWVQAFVHHHDLALSSLSKKEALRVLIKNN